MWIQGKANRPDSPSQLSLSSTSFENTKLSGKQKSNFTYSSFPSPVLGRSPTLPSFRIPKYGYYNIEGDRSPMSSPLQPANSGRRKNSVCRALIQSINYFVGIGVLTLPYALRTTGWFGLVLLVIFGLIMTATAWLFGRSRKKIYLETFSDHVEFAFATKGRVAISLVFYASLLINAGVFTKLLSDTLSSLTGLATSTTLLITAVVFAAVANTCTSSSSPLTNVMSLLGTVSTVVLLVALVIAEVLVLLRYEATQHSAESVYMRVNAVQALHGVWSYTVAERVYITDLIACLKTLGIFGYCYMGHEVFPAIFHNMRHPHCFTFVVSIAFSCMMLCYAAIATLGYLAYGTHSAGNIIDNFPPRDGITWCVQVCLVVTVLAKLTQCAAPLCEGMLEWTRLAVYLASHTKYLAGLVRQPARPMPRLRLDSSAHTVVPSQCTYGTYHSELGTRQALAAHRVVPPPALDLNTPKDRRKYFDTSYFDVEKEVSTFETGLNKDSAEETSSLLASGRSALPTLELKIPDSPPSRQQPPERPSRSRGVAPKLSRGESLQRGASWGTSGSTPRRGLTWSDTLPIPPIRSPSCENLLASSSDSTHMTGHRHAHAQAHGATTVGVSEQTHSNPLSTLTSLLGGALPTASSQKLPQVDVHRTESPLSKPSPESSSAETDDLFFDDADPPPSRQRQRLFSDFSDLLQAKQGHPTAQSASFPHSHSHSLAHPGSDDKEEHRCAMWGEYFLVQILPVVVRCTLPLLALAIASLFNSFVGMVIFTGGVCGGLVSIVIPTWAYLNIHRMELSTAEQSLLWVIISTGVTIAAATIVVAAL